MTDFTKIGELVTKAQDLLDSIKGGAIRIMQLDFEALKTKLNASIQHANLITVNAVADKMNRLIYVNQLTGDDTNSGTIDEPLKTFDKAADFAISGGILMIYLQADYDFSLDSGMPWFRGGRVAVRTDDSSKRRQIKFASYFDSTYQNQYFMRSFGLVAGASVEINGINLLLPDVPSGHSTGGYYPHGAAVFRGFSSGEISNEFGVVLRNCEIIVPEPERSEWHLIGNPSGISSLSVVNVTMPNEWRIRNKLAHKLNESLVVHTKLLTNWSGAIITGADTNTGIVK